MIVDSTVGLITNSSTSIYAEAYNPNGFLLMIEQIARLAGSPINVGELFEIVVVPDDMYRVYETYEEDDDEEMFDKIFGNVPINERGYRESDKLEEAWINAYRAGLVTINDIPANWLGVKDSQYVVFCNGTRTNLGGVLYNLYTIEAEYNG